jgi:hypothetical protein
MVIALLLVFQSLSLWPELASLESISSQASGAWFWYLEYGALHYGCRLCPDDHPNVHPHGLLLVPTQEDPLCPEATVAALLSDKLWPHRQAGADILAESTRPTEWGRETYYALRVLFKAGRTEDALDLIGATYVRDVEPGEAVEMNYSLANVSPEAVSVIARASSTCWNRLAVEPTV